MEGIFERTKRSEEMLEFFSEKANGYDGVHGVPDFMASKNTLAERLPEGTKRILDLGAGTGLELIAVYERFPEMEVTACDITAEMLAQIKERPFGERVTLLCGDFFDVDFGEGFDAVISTSALHHFDYPQKVELYKKVYGCLKAGGVFLDADYIVDTQEEEDALFIRYRDHRAEFRHCDTPLCAENEIKALGEAGFSAVYAEDIPQKDKYKLTVAQKEG